MRRSAILYLYLRSAARSRFAVIDTSQSATHCVATTQVQRNGNGLPSKKMQKPNAKRKKNQIKFLNRNRLDCRTPLWIPSRF